MSELIYPQHCNVSFAKKPSNQNGSNLWPNRVFKNEPLDDGRWTPSWTTPRECKTISKVLGNQIKKPIKGGWNGSCFLGIEGRLYKYRWCYHDWRVEGCLLCCFYNNLRAEECLYHCFYNDPRLDGMLRALFYNDLRVEGCLYHCFYNDLRFEGCSYRWYHNNLRVEGCLWRCFYNDLKVEGCLWRCFYNDLSLAYACNGLGIRLAHACHMLVTCLQYDSYSMCTQSRSPPTDQKDKKMNRAPSQRLT